MQIIHNLALSNMKLLFFMIYLCFFKEVDMTGLPAGRTSSFVMPSSFFRGGWG